MSFFRDTNNSTAKDLENLPAARSDGRDHRMIRGAGDGSRAFWKRTDAFSSN
jgi:hypothetical protein